MNGTYTPGIGTIYDFFFFFPEVRITLAWEKMFLNVFIFDTYLYISLF